MLGCNIYLKLFCLSVEIKNMFFYRYILYTVIINIMIYGNSACGTSESVGLSQL